MQDAHKFIHIFRSGKRINIEIIRDGENIPQFKTEDELLTLTIADELEYFYWVEYLMKILISEILNEKELNLLAKYGSSFMCK